MTGLFFFNFDHNSPAQNEGGQLNGGDAWYRKTFRLEDQDLDKKVRLDFGGVYMDSKVYVNGQFCWTLSKWLQCFFLMISLLI